MNTTARVGLICLLLIACGTADARDTTSSALLQGSAGRVDFDHRSGLYRSAFELRLTTSDTPASLFYTTNGTPPEPGTGLRYDRPIRIATTTIVRAAALSAQTKLTDIATRTFIFPTAVLWQNGDSLPGVWGTNRGEAIPAWYGLARAITNETVYAQGITEALQSLPSVSIVADPRDLFSLETGIYTHPTERGAAWERSAAVELFGGTGDAGFQTTCALRIHGGMSRHPEESPKHSFRLGFKRGYGPARLRFSLFGDQGAQEFKTLILRAGNNDSWLASSGEERRRASYIRDEWMRRSLQAMGYPAARGRFVHLYLNGLYWGLYDLCEAPRASAEAQADSRSDEGYDLVKGDQTEAGDRQAWEKLLALADGDLSDSGRYQALARLVDLRQLIDYLILNFYAGNLDWHRSANWYAVRPRTVAGVFQFYPWDAECVLREPEDKTIDFDDDESPPGLFQKLTANAQFRARFAASVNHLTQGTGPLAPEIAAERYRDLAKVIEPAISAEVARWGTYRRESHRYKTGPFEHYTLTDHWRPEIKRISAQYFPQRLSVVLSQFRERGLVSPTREPTGP